MKYSYSIAKKDILKVIWFNTNKHLIPKTNSMYVLRQSTKLDIPEKFIIIEKEFITTIIDLTKPIEKIWSKFNKKSTRYEINKAKKNIQKIEIIQDRNFETFFEMGTRYYWFKYNKKVSFNVKKITEKKQGKLFLAYYNKKLICGNYYLVDQKNKRIRLNYSFSDYLIDKEKRKISAFLTRYLHWTAINYFKENKFKIYDFGGINLDEKSKTYGITKFKISFGGKIIKEYDYLLHKKGTVFKRLLKNQKLVNIIRKTKLKKYLYG